MDMAIRGQPQIQTGQNFDHILGVQMMKETVDQNEIEGFLADAVELTRIGRQEFTAVSSPGVLDVAFIYINSEIIRVSEVPCIRTGAAGHVEHAAGTTQVISLKNRGKLLFHKRSLPSPVDESALQNGRRNTHDTNAARPPWKSRNLERPPS